MTEIENKLNIVKRNSEVSWFIAERWFRILEFSLILAALYYFQATLKNNIPIRIVYWLSWVLFWSWFEDIGKFIVEIICTKKKLSKYKRAFVWLVCTVLVMIIYIIVTSAANSMIAKEYL